MIACAKRHDNFILFMTTSFYPLKFTELSLNEDTLNFKTGQVNPLMSSAHTHFKV